MVERKGFVVTPILQFKAMQGWTRDGKTGQLVNPAKPDSDTVERVISFMNQVSGQRRSAGPHGGRIVDLAV